MLPYGAGLLVVLFVGPSLGAADRAGLTAVAIAPALLSAPALATAIGGRMDRAGALLVGSIGVWLVLTLSRGPDAAAAAQGAMLPFVVGAGLTSAVPMLPDIVRTTVRRIGDLAFVALAAVAASGAGGITAANGLAVVALFIAIVGTAAIVARIGGVDLASAIAGAGSRDPAVATGLAVALGGTVAIPLCSGILLMTLGVVLALRNRRKTG